MAVKSNILYHAHKVMHLKLLQIVNAPISQITAVMHFIWIIFLFIWQILSLSFAQF